jgi:hypothetical protein
MTCASGDVAEHAVAADRFAREILAFLKSSCAARLRQLNGNPLGRNSQRLSHPRGYYRDTL